MSSLCPSREYPGPALALVVCLIAFAQPVAAVTQQCFDSGYNDEIDFPCRFSAPRWSGELASLGANALIGGLTSGLKREFGDGNFSDGFLRGAFGGAITYVGKRVAAERFDGAGLLGRPVAAVGSSVARNAALGLPAFHHITLPLGPVWLEIRRDPDSRLAARLDPAALAWIVYGIVESELDFDAAETLSSGSAVFRTREKLLSLGDDSVHAAGLVNAGVMFLADVAAFGPERRRRAEAHERVHVLQEDQFAILWTAPAGAWAMRQTSLLAPLAPYVAVNLSTEMFRLLASLFDTHEDRPWELESIFHAR
ncbi:MAG: hypothetical protein ACREL7_04705 [Longimicrobiales bacterium]